MIVPGGARSSNAGRARDQADLGVLDLTGRLAAELPDAFDDVVQAVDVGFGEATAVGVRGERAVGPGERAARREGATLAARAETEVLERGQDEAAEVVVDLATSTSSGPGPPSPEPPGDAGGGRRSHSGRRPW